MAGTGNRLLDTLSEPLRHRVLGVATLLPLPIKTLLFAAGEQSRYIFFLTQGVASQVVSTRSGESAETGMIGAESLVGASALLGPAVYPYSCFMQISGAGLRVSTADMRAIFEESPELRRCVLQRVQVQMLALSQNSACSVLHEAEQRLARWLLIAADLSRADTMDLTQEFLSQMLGSQRTTVSMIAGTLQERGLIAYTRGKVSILDRQGLTETACDCYAVISALYGPFVAER